MKRLFETVDIDFTEEDFSGIRDEREIETQVSIGDYGIVIDDEDKAIQKNKGGMQHVCW